MRCACLGRVGWPWNAWTSLESQPSLSAGQQPPSCTGKEWGIAPWGCYCLWPWDERNSVGGRGGFPWFLCLPYFSWEAKYKGPAPGGGANVCACLMSCHSRLLATTQHHSPVPFGRCVAEAAVQFQKRCSTEWQEARAFGRRVGPSCSEGGVSGTNSVEDLPYCGDSY